MRLEDVGPQRNLPDSAEPWGRYTDQKIRELQRQVQRLTGETKGVRQVVAAAADSADALVTDAKVTADQAQETGDIAYEEAANAAQEAVDAKETADLAIEDAAAAFREANAARQAAAEAWKQAANQTPNWSFEEGSVRWASNFGFNDTNISEVTGAPDGRYVARVTLGSSVRHELRTANDDAHRVEPERIWDVVVRARVTSGSATIGVGAYVFNKSNSGFAYLVPTTESRTTAGGWVTLRARIETNDVTHEFIAPMVTAQNVVGNTVEFDAVEFKDVTDAVLAQTIADAAAFQAAQALSKANDAQDAADDAQGTADQAVQDALAAKNRADQAHANAATAQGTADSAAQAAASAAGIANDAQDAADAAAADAIAKASAAETAAKAHADAQAAAAQAAAIAAASGDATDKAAAAQAAAEAAAATDALAKANAAQAAAEAKAEEARLLAAGKADVLIQPSAPAVAMRKATTLWIDTTNGANTPKRWSGSAWVTVTDKAATDAANAAANAQAAADAAQQAADAAQAAADAAQEAADAAMDVATDAQKDATEALDRAKSRMRAGQNVITNGDFEDTWLGWNLYGDERFSEVIEDPNARSRSKVLALRPSGKIVAENLIPDPRGKTVSLWRAQGTVGITSEGITALENAGGGSLYIDSSKDFQDIKVGDVFTFTVQVKVTLPLTMKLQFGAYNGASGVHGEHTPNYQVPEDGWVTYTRSYTVTAAPVTGYIRALVWPNNMDHPEGEGFIIRNASLQRNTEEPWFSGASSNSGQISYEWSGTPDESTSLKRDGTARNVYPATDWYPTSGGREYTIEAWVKLVDPAKSNGVFRFYCVTRGANEAWTGAWTSNDTSIPAGSLTHGEWTKFTSTFITPADAVSINFAPHVMSGTGEVYVDDVLIIDTTESTAARIIGEEALLGVHDAVVDLTELFTTEIAQTSDQILSTVTNEYVANTDMIEEIGLIQSQIDQQSENIDFRFIEVSESVIDLEGELQGYQSELATYIRFNNDGIELGKVGDPFIAKLTNTELAFIQAGQKVAYVSNNQLYITNATINSNLAMGTGGAGYFDWIPRENGNLTFKFRGDSA